MAGTERSGFLEHVKLVFTESPEQYGDYQKNYGEKAGQFLMWHVVKLPVHIYNSLHNPKVLIVTSGALAMAAVQFGFYPVTTVWAMKAAVTVLSQHIALPHLKLAAYVATQTAIFGWVVRSLGRVENKVLMQHFYGGQARTSTT